MEEKHSWLDSPQIPGEFDSPDKLSDYPSQALDLVPDGPDSRATLVRHADGIFIDWVTSLVIASAFSMFFGSGEEQIEQFRDSFIAWQSFLATYTPVVFPIIGTVSVWLFARTPDQWMMKMGVVRADKPGERVGLVRAFFRSLLTLSLLPPAVTDSDMRDMHDRTAGTAVILG